MTHFAQAAQTTNRVVIVKNNTAESFRYAIKTSEQADLKTDGVLLASGKENTIKLGSDWTSVVSFWKSSSATNRSEAFSNGSVKIYNKIFNAAPSFDTVVVEINGYNGNFYVSTYGR